MMLELLGWVIFGFGVGLLARALLPGRDKMGFAATTALGIIGALLGGWLGKIFGFYSPGASAGWIAATLGAIVVLTVYNRVVKNRSDRRRQLTSVSTERPEKTDRVA